MTRRALLGAGVFGASAALAGYLWTAFEFPFAIVVPAFLGWYAVTREGYGNRTALLAGAVGGVSFTAAFLLAVFVALTDGSPLAISAWLGATLAAGLAGALTGALLGGVRGSATLAAFSAAGMLVAVAVAGLMRMVAPATIDVAGQAQYLYFALVQGLIGLAVGGFIGAGTAYLSAHSGGSGSHAGRASPAA